MIGTSLNFALYLPLHRTLSSHTRRTLVYDHFQSIIGPCSCLTLASTICRPPNKKLIQLLYFINVGKESCQCHPPGILGYWEKVVAYTTICSCQISLTGQHHVQYHGNAFYIEKGDYIEVLMNSHIMVDVAYLHKANPNYIQPHINNLIRPNSSDSFFFFSDTEVNTVKSSSLDMKAMNEDNLMICSQTVYNWSLTINSDVSLCSLNTL